MRTRTKAFYILEQYIDYIKENKENVGIIIKDVLKNNIKRITDDYEALNHICDTTDIRTTPKERVDVRIDESLFKILKKYNYNQSTLVNILLRETLEKFDDFVDGSYIRRRLPTRVLIDEEISNNYKDIPSLIRKKITYDHLVSNRKRIKELCKKIGSMDGIKTRSYFISLDRDVVEELKRYKKQKSLVVNLILSDLI